MLSARMALARSLRDGIDYSPVIFGKRIRLLELVKKKARIFAD
jgi:hypothetical protein